MEEPSPHGYRIHRSNFHATKEERELIEMTDKKPVGPREFWYKSTPRSRNILKLILRGSRRKSSLDDLALQIGQGNGLLIILDVRSNLHLRQLAIMTMGSRARPLDAIAAL